MAAGPSFPLQPMAAIRCHCRSCQNGGTCQRSKPQPAAIMRNCSQWQHLLSCLSLQPLLVPPQLPIMAAPPLQPPGAAPQRWHLSQSHMWPGRTSHSNPRAPCKKKGVKKSYQSLSLPSSGPEILPILTLEISALRSSDTSEILYTHCPLVQLPAVHYLEQRKAIISFVPHTLEPPINLSHKNFCLV